MSINVSLSVCGEGRRGCLALVGCFCFPGKVGESTLLLLGEMARESHQGSLGREGKRPWVQTPALSLASCATLNTSLSLSEPWFAHLQPPGVGKTITGGKRCV